MTQGLPFEPTEEQRKTVRVMSGFGIPHPDIATLLEIDPKTLRLHFRRELDRGSVEATTKVAQTLFQIATSGQNTAATIFWMKARAGWREKQDVSVEHSGEMRQSYVIYGGVAPPGDITREEWVRTYGQPALGAEVEHDRGPG